MGKNLGRLWSDFKIATDSLISKTSKLIFEDKKKNFFKNFILSPTLLKMTWNEISFTGYFFWVHGCLEFFSNFFICGTLF